PVPAHDLRRLVHRRLVLLPRLRGAAGHDVHRVRNPGRRSRADVQRARTTAFLDVSSSGSDGPPASGTLPFVLGRPRLARWLVALVRLLGAPARAARTFHLFLDESQLGPEGGIELEQWVWAYGRIPNRSGRPASMWLWWGPAVSVSNHLEFELPLQVVSVP